MSAIKISAIKVNNYKSIGEEKNVLYLDDRVTALIGKNESGKSNLLESIGKMNFYQKSNPKYFNQYNRLNNKNISINLKLYFTDRESRKYNNDSQTELHIQNQDITKVKGGLSKVISDDKDINMAVEKILSLTKLKGIWATNANDKEQINKRNQILNVISEYSDLLMLNPNQSFRFLKSNINNSFEKKEDLIEKLDILENKMSIYLNLLPTFFYRENDQYLKHYYNLKTIEEIFKNKDDIFYRFMQTAKITEEDILAALNKNDPGNKISARRRINKNIKKEIEERFNDFYTQEKIELEIDFEDSALNFIVSSNDGEVYRLSERSNGLRWYLSLFIDIIPGNVGGSSTVFLLDEPGVHLHVNAQRELLDLFYNLADENHQVIYTSHSPSMIDGENITNIRVVEKVEDYTSIYNSCYNPGIPENSKMETLSPLVKAIGADLKFNIGAQYTKNNIITEGITDYMYIKAMMHALDITDGPYILPAVGATNVKSIAMIIHGWGLDYKILFDHDEEGYREYKKIIKDTGEEFINEISFVNGKVPLSIEDVKRHPVQIECLITDEDFKKLTNNSRNASKTLVAKEFYDKVSNGQITPEGDTIDSFRRLFEKLEIIKVAELDNSATS